MSDSVQVFCILIFCLLVQWGLLWFPTIVTDLSTFFSSINFFFMYFEVLLCDTLRIITSFWWIMKCPSLYLIIFLFVLKLSHNATATPSFLWISVWVVYLFLSFLLQFISVFVFKVSFRQHVFSFPFFKKIKWLLLLFNCV